MPYPSDLTPSSTVDLRDRLIPKALYFDPRKRTSALTSGGRPFYTHPVDARVLLALVTRRGSMASLPDFGLDWKRLQRGGSPAELEDRAVDAVREALAAELAGNNIELISVTAVSSAERLTLTVRYRNLRFLSETERSLDVASA